MSKASSSSASMGIAGTFNGWDPHDPACQAEHIGSGRYEIRRILPRGRHAFRWVAGDRREKTLGGHGNEALTLPTEGQAVPGGEEIVLNVLIEASYHFALDTKRGQWHVSPTDPTLNPLNALRPHHLLQTGFAPMVEALRADADGQPFGYAWERWDQVRPFLEHGTYRGVLPLHTDNRVLFVYNEALSGPLFLAGSMNDWSVGPDRFERVPGTDVHLLCREFEPGSLHYYKLHHDGAWFSDPTCGWASPDGIPVPMFCTGTFNSVLDLGEPACERANGLLWLRRFPSVIRNNERDIFVALPRGYTDGDRRYPVLYVQDGNEALTRTAMHDVARQVSDAGQSQPCILVFVALASQLERTYEYSDLEGRSVYADFLTRELIPFIDGHFRTQATPAGRGIVGASYGGTLAYFVGWRDSDVIGKVAGQGAAFHAHDWEILRLYAESPRRDLQLYLDSARATAPGRPRDNAESSRYAERLLKRMGYDVRHVKRQDQRHDWPSWQERFPEVLRTFWPA